VQVAVDPGVRRPLDHIDELLLGALGVGKGGAPSWRQTHMMDANPGQAEQPAQRRADAHQLIVAVIVIVVSLLELAPVGDEGWALDIRHDVPPIPD